MTRISQILKGKRKKNLKLFSNNSFIQKPQRKGICVRSYTLSPKKPNSANRRVVNVNIKLFNKSFFVVVKIPGEGHNLQQHSNVLLRSGKVRDLVGVKNIAIRGKFDLVGVFNRKTSRSIYGIKKKK